MPHIAAVDLFVVPTIGFNVLYVLVIVRLARRELVWLNVTAHPTAEWIGEQGTEAFPGNEVSRYLIRKNGRPIGNITFEEAVASYNGDCVLHFHHPTWRHDQN